jgi:hypothetical protein
MMETGGLVTAVMIVMMLVMVGGMVGGAVWFWRRRPPR